jgi:CheY-like chemotaxis protein
MVRFLRGPLVDDESVIAQTLAVILNHAGSQTTAFDHPEKAIAATAELRPDLLISDVIMPGMTGVELAIHFRKTQPDCKFCCSQGRRRPPISWMRLAIKVTTSIYSQTRPSCGPSDKAARLTLQPTASTSNRLVVGQSRADQPFVRYSLQIANGLTFGFTRLL